MRTYGFYKQNGYGAEKSYFEDDCENIVIINAENAEQAKKTLLSLASDEEVSGYEAEELEVGEDHDMFPKYYTIWN